MELNPPPPTTTSNPAPPPILTLPPELHQEIAFHLSSYDDDDDASAFLNAFTLLNLRLTNRYFYTTIPAPTHTTLLQLEAHSDGTLGYACHHCLRLRPASKFAASMLKGKTGLNGGRRARRFCADCGFDVEKRERYTPGRKVVVDGVTWVYCAGCRRVKKGEEAGIEQCTRFCEPCYKRLGCMCYDTCVPKKRAEPAMLLFGVVPECTSPSGTESDEGYDYEAERLDEMMYFIDMDDDDWRTL